MKKRLTFLFILIVCLSMISAFSFRDALGKITGYEAGDHEPDPSEYQEVYCQGISIEEINLSQKDYVSEKKPLELFFQKELNG